MYDSSPCIMAVTGCSEEEARVIEWSMRHLGHNPGQLPSDHFSSIAKDLYASMGATIRRKEANNNTETSDEIDLRPAPLGI
jgi:hypothetical protein